MAKISSSERTGRGTVPLGPQRSNGFDVLRIVAALFVIFGHSFPLTGNVAPGVFGNGIQTIGVKIFFVISGYLICKSWIKDRNFIKFSKRRLRRIMPGLIGAVVFCAVIVGPIFTTLPVMQYVEDGGFIAYFWNIALFPTYGLPGVFAENLYPHAVNGSLWSLPIEMAMYVTIPLLVGFGATRARLVLVLVTIITAALGVYFVRIAPVASPPVIYGSSLISLLEVAPYFQIGAICAVCGLDRYFRPMVLLFAFLATGYLVSGYAAGEICLLFLLPPAVVAVGSRHFPGWEKWVGHNDVSYGLYLYGFPLQQAVSAVIANALGAVGNFVISLPLVFIMAQVSWAYLERPFMDTGLVDRLKTLWTTGRD